MKPILKSWLLHTLREEFWASNLLQLRVPRSDLLRCTCVLFYCCCALARAITLVTCLEFKLGIGFSLFNTYFPLCWKKRITELLSCFISSLIVKVIKYRFVAPGKGFYQDGCVSLIKYGPCFTRLLHLNDTYFDTLQFFFSKIPHSGFQVSFFALAVKVMVFFYYSSIR